MTGPIREPDAAGEFHERTKLGPAGWPREEDLLPPVPHGSVLHWTRLPSVAVSSGPSLELSIRNRRTSRSFDPGSPLSVELLARLLALSCGQTASMGFVPGIGHMCHRATPSAGARYPIEVRLAALRIADLPPGVYAYDPMQHALGWLRQGFFGDVIARWCLNQPWMAEAGVVFALVADPARIEDRYGSRGYRYTLFEAGHIAQNLYLLGAAYGLCVQATGGFLDDALGRLFGLDGTRRHVVYLVAVGSSRLRPAVPPW